MNIKASLNKGAFIVALFLSTAISCSEQSEAAECGGAIVCQHPIDYTLHAAGGYAITAIMAEHGYTPTQTVLTVLTVALVKEYAIDKNPDPADTLSWLGGPVLYYQFRWDF